MKSNTDLEALLKWYNTNKRDLPWRKNRDPYKIWISETMLQQTTTRAVIPYFERFIQRFPTLTDLATASIGDVYTYWAGLGYYSRARNLHAAAKLLAALPQFPQSHHELLELPGFGPYTARAVSSIAFSEPVGVLDGNVIRVFSRRFNLNSEWWRQKERQLLQNLVDGFVAKGPTHIANQALMELGAQVCTPRNPLCTMCPWLTSCKARKAKTIEQRPLKKPKKECENWLWHVDVNVEQKKIRLIKNNYAPFLRNQWLPPGQAVQLKQKPKIFDFRHSITHHNIFVQLAPANKNIQKKLKSDEIWAPIKDLPKYSPTSLVRKVIEHVKTKKQI